MSLILDALKKSEQERRRDRAPDLQTIHQPVSAPPPARSRTALWLVLLVAVNGAALAWWWQHQRPSPQAAAAPVPAVADASPVARAASAPPATPAPPPAQEKPEFTEISPTPPPAPKPTRLLPDRPMPVREVSELPDSVRESLPAMTFSFHVYSADPQKRTIIINNRRLREGDTVSDGVVLEEITEDGVILDKAPYRIHIGVLTGW